MYALQAITTKYLAPTNTRGARIKATAQAGSITIPWDYSHEAIGNHYKAACELARRIDGLTVDAVTLRPHAFGALPNDRGYVLTFRTF